MRRILCQNVIKHIGQTKATIYIDDTYVEILHNNRMNHTGQTKTNIYKYDTYMWETLHNSIMNHTWQTKQYTYNIYINTYVEILYKGKFKKTCRAKQQIYI